MLQSSSVRLIGFVVATSIPCAAVAVPYTAELSPLNDSGVSGTASLTLDNDLLTVSIDASGLEADQIHPQHIHGRFDDDGNPIDSVFPTAADDTDGDGFIEVAEGAASYGPIIIPLTSPPGGAVENFPTATPDGTVSFTQTYDLTSDTTFAEGFDSEDLLPLDLREIVIHGLTVADGVGDGTPGEVDGTDGYKDVLPVAAGEIVEVVEPTPPAPPTEPTEPAPPPTGVSLPATALLMLPGLLAAFGGNYFRRRGI